MSNSGEQPRLLSAGEPGTKVDTGSRARQTQGSRESGRRLAVAGWALHSTDRKLTAPGLFWASSSVTIPQCVCLYNKGHKTRVLPIYCSDSLSSYHGEILSAEQQGRRTTGK